jgi:hypothetical protein
MDRCAAPRCKIGCPIFLTTYVAYIPMTCYRIYAVEGHRRARYRSFNVARPAIARIQAIIQKRITMVGSAQPFCSK